jgi:hypothetical protein
MIPEIRPQVQWPIIWAGIHQIPKTCFYNAVIQCNLPKNHGIHSDSRTTLKCGPASFSFLPTQNHLFLENPQLKSLHGFWIPTEQDCLAMLNIHSQEGDFHGGFVEEKNQIINE